MKGISDELRADLEAIAESETDNFLELVELSGLDPSTDFVGVDLRGADLSGLDLTDFDLTGADVSGAIIEGAKFHPKKSPKTAASSHHSSEIDIERAWVIADTVDEDPSISDQFSKLMNDIRSDGIMPGPQKFRKLVSQVTGYEGRPSLLGRVLRRRNTRLPAPNWLRDFLLERYSVISHRLSKEYIREVIQAGLINDFTEKEKLKKSTVWGEFDHKRGQETEKLAKEHGKDEDVYEFLSDLALNDRSFSVREAAIGNLVPNDQRLDHYRELAMSIFENDANDRVRGAAISALSYLRKIDTEVWVLLFRVSNDLDCVSPRAKALLSLEHEFGADKEIDSIIVEALHKSIVGDTDEAMLAAISVLGRLGTGLEEIGQYFFDRFNEHTSDLARYWLFSVLERAFEESPIIHRAVEIDLANSESYICREKVLSYIVSDNSRRERYLERLAKQESLHSFRQVRRIAHMAVANSSWESADKVSFLIKMFREDDDVTNKGMIARKLVSDFPEFEATKEFFINLDEVGLKAIEFVEEARKYRQALS